MVENEIVPAVKTAHLKQEKIKVAKEIPRFSKA